MKKKIRLLFLLIIPALFVQFYIAVKVSEPYPAIMMPAFNGVPKKDSCIALDKFSWTAFYSNQDSIAISPLELFNHVPSWHIYFLSNRIIDKIPVSPSNFDNQAYIDFTKYLSKRLYKLTKRRGCLSLKLEQIEYYECESDQFIKESSILNTRIIVLNNDN